MSRPCKLQINTAGAWRDLLRFDIDEVDEQDLQETAARLVQLAEHPCRATLRICMADALQSTLVRWSADTGWRPA